MRKTIDNVYREEAEVDNLDREDNISRNIGMTDGPLGIWICNFTTAACQSSYVVTCHISS